MNLGLINLPQLLVLSGLTGAVLVSTAIFQQPLHAQPVPLQDEKPTLAYFPQLPPAKQKLIAAVDEFRDPTTPYQQIRTGQTEITSPTALTQNLTNTLIRTLEESGWFVPVAYGNIINLLNKPRSPQLNGAQPEAAEKLPSIPSADIFLEGGILSNDATLITDRDGTQYFGPGSSPQYQQDRVTVYLRAVSIPSGKILKTIYTSKTILSQPVDASLFRYVSFKGSREAETSLTPILPGQLAATEAIKKAVQALIIEGVRDGLWLTAESSAMTMRALINTYEREKSDMSQIDLFGIQPDKGLFRIRPQINAPFISVHPYAGILRYSGDYARRSLKGTYGVAMEMFLTPALGVQVNAATGMMASRDAFSVKLTALEGNLVFRPLPYQRWTPLLYGGVGIISRSRLTPFQLYGSKYGQVQGGIGVQFSPNNAIGFRSTLSYCQPFTDALDGKITGSHRDYYMRITLGVVIHAGRFLPKTKPITLRQAAPPRQ